MRFNHHDTKLTTEILEMLGKRPDLEIAQAAGVPRSIVIRWRKQRNIRLDPRVILDFRYPGLVDLLGKQEDLELALKFRLARQTVASLRHKLEIPTYRDPAYPHHKRRPLWDEKHPGLIEMLRTSSDSEVADEFGLSRQRVNQIRKKSLVERNRIPPKDYSQIDPLLGTVSDEKIATQFGLTERIVSLRRRKLGIKGHKTIEWSQFESLLGTMSDAKLARHIGCTQISVASRRNLLRLPPFSRYSRWNPIPKDQVFELVGEGVSDQKIAHVLGCSEISIYSIRKGRR